MSTKTTLKKDEKPRIVGIFGCPNCKIRFRSVATTEIDTTSAANIKNIVERIKSIKGELMQTLLNLREKINTLETERANLMEEIEKLRKIAETRVNTLENEVSMLRNEAKSLRDLLGYAEQEETTKD
jgi:uncharacterized Zn finger protein (UPF0148 family)